MSLQAPYDDDNIFAKIIRGEMPNVTVYEDDATLAFMDVFPQADGHMLVISKNAKSVNLLDLPAEAMAPMLTTAQKVARAAKDALQPDGLRLMQFNGSAAGQTVFHTHIHVIPVWSDRGMAPHASDMAPTEHLEDLAAKIRHAL